MRTRIAGQENTTRKLQEHYKKTKRKLQENYTKAIIKLQDNYKTTMRNKKTIRTL